MIKLQNNAQIHRSNFGNSRPSSNALLSRTYLNCHTTQTAPSYYFTAITLTFKRRINLQILGEKKKRTKPLPQSFQKHHYSTPAEVQ